MLQPPSAVVSKLKESIRLVLADAGPHPRPGDVPSSPSNSNHQKTLAIASAISGTHDVKYCLECASRELLYEIIVSLNPEALLYLAGPCHSLGWKTDFEGKGTLEGFSALYDLFDLVLVLSELDIGDQQLPFTIIEETLDTQAIEGCKRIFLYLEARIDRLTVGVDGNKGKGIILLRLCNELLRRLSKSEDTVFCGRIFVFLTKSFPLSERSGVNLRGEFHVDNKTTFDNEEESNQHALPAGGVRKEQEPDQPGSHTPTASGDAMDMALSDASLAADAGLRLYTTLWSTQHDFAEPTRLFQKPNLDSFKTSLEAVIKAFKASIDEHGHNLPSAALEIKRGIKRKRDGDDRQAELNNYNPKYLTSRELFDLEVRDLVFRRHILVQFLIVIEFLLSLSLKYKKYLEAEAKNRSVLFPYTLADEDDKWAETAKKDIVGALNYKSGMDGLLFSRTVDSVLTREKNWVKWKAENCLSFEMDPVQASNVTTSTTIGDENTQLPRIAEGGMGAPALSNVWFGDADDSTSKLSLVDSQRTSLPDYKEYNKAIEGYCLDKDFASTDQEKEDIDESISNQSWRALRIASKDRFHFFKGLDEDLSIRSLITAEDAVSMERKELDKGTR
ncbi:hypothetical protein Dda_1374 [Drechslerella dactyloides]|uniref:Nuclear matrix protein n=1 Tax=Drechslerella dactyloides TaxID=74499 RepID=A0AAD6J2X2_DREDA|nr:hypothetical protein Dda_1374 [Drechslerella dactyloides]